MNLAILTLAVVIQGTVVESEGPLPGCTLHLVSANQTHEAMSDSAGKFIFPQVATGTYELTSTLSGFETYTRLVDVHADEVLAPIEMKMAPVTEPILTCGVPLICRDNTPATKRGLPRCADYELHTSLIEAAGRGDRSAIAMLRRRYDLETSIRERYRIAGALLGKVDDRELWAELYESAALVVRFAPRRDESPEAFLEYGRQRSLTPDDVWIAGNTALRYASADPRARALLHDALKTSDRAIIDIALDGLTAQRDHSSLPAIRALLARETDRASWLALKLARFNTVEADALAFEYLLEDARELYLEHRSR